MPVWPVAENNIMEFYPHGFGAQVENNSGDYDYYVANTWRGKIKDFSGGKDVRVHPAPVNGIPADATRLTVVPPLGGIMLFSGDQLHASIPNTSGITRYSIDFRTVHVDDVHAGVGAPVADVACTGTAMRDFKRMTDGASFTEDEVAPYDSESADGRRGRQGVRPHQLSAGKITARANVRLCTQPRARREVRPAAGRAGGGVRGTGRRVLRQPLQRQVHRPLQLRVAARGVVLRGDHHLDVRVDAPVLHLPPGVVEPRRVARLRHPGAVDQPVAAVDPDHPTPGPRADHRPDAQPLDRRGDDVAVRAGVLVGQRDHRAAGGVVGVRERLAVPRHVPPDHPPRQLLDHQLRGVPAAVAPDVEDQAVAGGLPAQVAVQLRPPARHHVRDVQVAQPALGAVGHERPPARHPVLVAQLPLRRERLDDHPAHLARAVPAGTRVAGPGAHRQLDEPVRRAHQQRRGPPLRVDRAPGHLEDHVAGPHVDPRPGQRAARVRCRRLGRQHPDDAPAVVVARSGRRPAARAAPTSRPRRPRTRTRATCPARR